MNYARVATAAALGALIVVGCARFPSASETSAVRIVAPAHPYASLVCIAHRGGGFTRQGLNVELEFVADSSAAVNRLYAQESDYAIASTYAYALSLTQPRKPPRILAEVFSGRLAFGFVSRKSLRLADAKALEGRRIGVEPTASVAAIVEGYLVAAGVQRKSVRFFEAPAAELIRALREGQIDAAFFLEPGLSEVEAELGVETIQVLRGQQNALIDVLIANTATIKGGLENQKRLIAALIEAESRLAEPGPETFEMLSSCFPTFSDEALRKVLDTQGFRVLGSEQLRFHFGQAVEWVKRTGDPYAPTPPNFEEVFYKTALFAVDAPRVLLQ